MRRTSVKSSRSPIDDETDDDTLKGISFNICHTNQRRMLRWNNPQILANNTMVYPISGGSVLVLPRPGIPRREDTNARLLLSGS
jgi:hypothetical protein